MNAAEPHEAECGEHEDTDPRSEVSTVYGDEELISQQCARWAAGRRVTRQRFGRARSGSDRRHERSLHDEQRGCPDDKPRNHSVESVGRCYQQEQRTGESSKHRGNGENQREFAGTVKLLSVSEERSDGSWYQRHSAGCIRGERWHPQTDKGREGDERAAAGDRVHCAADRGGQDYEKQLQCFGIECQSRYAGGKASPSFAVRPKLSRVWGAVIGWRGRGATGLRESGTVCTFGSVTGVIDQDPKASAMQ